MSKIEELIKEKCPNGVDFYPLGEVCTVVRGASPRPIKNFITEEIDSVNWIKIGDVAVGSKYITSCAERITREGAKKSRFVKKGDFILSNSMSFGRPYILEIDGCIHDGWLAISDFEDKMITDYLYYVLVSGNIQREMEHRASFGGAVQNLNADIVRAIEIPVPPIEVQQEIVRILDKFTELEAELQAELDARKKQYVAISDNIFGREIERKNITEIADTYIGLVTTMTKHYVTEGVTLIHNSDIKENRFQFSEKTYLDQDFADKNKSRKHQLKDIVTVHTGDVGTSAMIEDELVGSLGFATIVTRIKDQKQFLPEYVCYYLNSADNKRNIARMIKSDRSNLNLKDFNRLTIPVYDIDTQKKIVQVLSKFHEISVDVGKGLPAEIEARHKQYEYYRDKLLTFKRKEA